MTRMNSLRLAVAIALTAITGSAAAEPAAVSFYKQEVTGAIHNWTGALALDDQRLAIKFDELKALVKDPNAAVELKKKQDEITALKSTIEKGSGQIIVQFVRSTLSSPAVRDKTLANQKGLGSELARWIKAQIKQWAMTSAWKQIKGVEPDVEWSDGSFSSGERPSINIKLSFASDEKNLKP